MKNYNESLISLIESTFNHLNYKIIYVNSKINANGPDLWVIKDNKRPLSVEIKIARNTKKTTYAVEPVSIARQKDDLIAIVLNENYVLIEEMKHHLLACSKKGFRQFSTLLN